MPILIEDFITNSRERYNSIIMAAREENLSELEHHAHALCSSAATFGAFHLRKLVQNIEEACLQKEKDTAIDLANHIETIGDDTEENLRLYVVNNR